MKKQSIPILVILTIAFTFFTLGFFLGKSKHPEPVMVSLPDSMYTTPAETTVLEETHPIPEPSVIFPIDINRAEKEELIALPGIGDVLAQRILLYREENGAFTSVEELLNVSGIGKKRFEEILDLITIGG